MLRALRIANFKVFGDLQDIPLAPITLIYGPNSAGKSSVIQSLLLLAQSSLHAASASNRPVFAGDLIDLGTCQSSIHKHDTSRQIHIGCSFAFARDRARFTGIEFLKVGNHRNVDFSIAIEKGQRDEYIDPVIREVTYSFDQHSLPIRFVERPAKGEKVEDDLPALFKLADKKSAVHLGHLLELRRTQTPGPGAKKAPQLSARDLELRHRVLARQSFASWGLVPSTCMISSGEQYAKLQEDLGAEWTNEIFSRSPLEAIRREFLSEMRSLSYLGPLRSHPARHYIMRESDIDTVGNRGEKTPEILYRKRNLLVREISEWFARFGIPYSIDVERAGDPVTGLIMSIVLQDQRSLRVSPADVGFGIGQLLPILVEGCVSLGKTICVEQPEIHLHPVLQGNVADFLIDTAKLRTIKGSPGVPEKYLGGNQWIVETHSEALMLRLARRIAQGIIPPEYLSVLFVEPLADGQSRVMRLRLDERGDFIDEWPGGFFEERFNEIFLQRSKS